MNAISSNLQASTLRMPSTLNHSIFYPPTAPDSTDWSNIDPRLWPGYDSLPAGDPFPNKYPRNTMPTNTMPTDTMPTDTILTDTMPTDSVPTHTIPTNILPTAYGTLNDLVATRHGFQQSPTNRIPMVQWSPMPPTIIPPNFSAASTPARTPRKRKRSELLTVETPTSVRPKRQIVTPKRYIENAST